MAAANMLSRTKATLDTVGAAQLSQLLRAPVALAMQWQQPAGEAKAAPRHEDAVPAMVFLGPPGVGKGTYSTRVAERFGVAHVSAGDLARDEMRAGTARGRQMRSIVDAGELLPDSLMLEVLNQRLAAGQAAGESGVLLDGFPRTRAQAEALVQTADVQLAVNLHVREQILIAKCLGRRICGHCGKNYNVADIFIPATDGSPAVTMPPLSPPPECEQHMQRRSDDTLEIIKKRLEVYNAAAKPVEDFFREQGTLLDFDIYSGIPETMPRLLRALGPFQHGFSGGERRATVG